LITGGVPVSAPKALELGMIDALAAEGKLREDAIAFAAKLVAEGGPLMRVCDRQDKVEPFRGKPEIYADYLKKMPEHSADSRRRSTSSRRSKQRLNCRSTKARSASASCSPN
jgi:enoyl-CoA hydratase/carnithine racemase